MSTRTIFILCISLRTGQAHSGDYYLFIFFIENIVRNVVPIAFRWRLNTAVVFFGFILSIFWVSFVTRVPFPFSEIWCVPIVIRSCVSIWWFLLWSVRSSGDQIFLSSFLERLCNVEIYLSLFRSGFKCIF